MYVLIYCEVLQIYVGMINCSHCYNCKSVIVLLGAINEFEFEFESQIIALAEMMVLDKETVTVDTVDKFKRKLSEFGF